MFPVLSFCFHTHRVPRRNPRVHHPKCIARYRSYKHVVQKAALLGRPPLSGVRLRTRAESAPRPSLTIAQAGCQTRFFPADKPPHGLSRSAGGLQPKPQCLALADLQTQMQRNPVSMRAPSPLWLPRAAQPPNGEQECGFRRTLQLLTLSSGTEFTESYCLAQLVITFSPHHAP